MKKVLQVIAAFFASLFSSAQKFEQFLADHVDDAIDIVSKIKAAVNNPVIGSIFFFFPEKYKAAGAEALLRVQTILDKVLAELQMSDECLKKATTYERLKCFIEQLKQLSPAMQDAAYHKFAALYAKNSSGGKLSNSAYDTAVQNRFFVQKANIEV